MTTLARLGSWPLRVGWVLLAVASGPTGADALDGAPTAATVLVATAAWTAWGAVVVALGVPRTTSLTVVRTLVPLAPVAAVGAVAAGSDPSALDAAVLGLSTATATWAFAPFVTDEFVDGSSYGPERRFAVRTPVPVAAVAIVAWSVATAVLAAAVVSATAGRWALAAAASVGTAAVATLVVRSIHQLSRRWLVLVPTGLVVHDPLELAEAQLLPRRSLRAVGPAAADAPDGATTLDLTGGAVGLAMALVLAEPVDLAVREGQGAAITHADRLLVTPLRPAALLAAAEAHRLPVTTAGA
ncbi:MAG: hypothetical protein KDA97_07785 [Acidimicrobiales bacterium]|nr:hypothetical protein [Acidimicrobiales bacterium]